MRTKARRIAVGGIVAAVSFVLCWLGSVSMGGKFIAPAIGGLLLCPVARYISARTAVTVYIATSLLLLLLPNRVSGYAYILLLGYYPVVNGVLQGLPVWLRLLVKAVILTAVGCAALLIGAAVLGLWNNGKFVNSYPLLIAAYYVVCVIYDVFIRLLRQHMESHWSAKLKELFR